MTHHIPFMKFETLGGRESARSRRVISAMWNARFIFRALSMMPSMRSGPCTSKGCLSIKKRTKLR